MHHYGRHGQGAWLRRDRKRRRKSLSSPIVLRSSSVPFTVTTIPFPVGVGRIIIIVVGDGTPEFPDETHLSPLPPPIVDANQAASPQPVESPVMSEKKERILQFARYDAREDLERKLSELDGTTFLSIDFSNLEVLAKQQGKQHARELPYGGGTDTVPSLIDAYSDAYIIELRNASNGVYKDRFISDDEIDFQEIVDKDRQAFLTNHQGSHHLRDIAVIRALEYLQIPLEQSVIRLAEIHTWADRYEEVRRVPKKWEVWPDKDSFRPNRSF